MNYFAYGSNMSLARLRQRVPSAKRIGLFILEQHALRFHKVSHDGSAKCDAYYTGNAEDKIIGALFHIDIGEKPNLDRAEGLGMGYDEKTVSVFSEEGVYMEATTYYATQIDPKLKPYGWYLNHVVIGAKETGIKGQYLVRIKNTDCIEDTDKARDKKQRAIHTLANT